TSQGGTVSRYPLEKTSTAEFLIEYLRWAAISSGNGKDCTKLRCLHKTAFDFQSITAQKRSTMDYSRELFGYCSGLSPTNPVFIGVPREETRTCPERVSNEVQA